MRPACAKPLRRRQGTPLAGFFNTLQADEVKRELAPRLLTQTKDFLRWLETLPR